ncbi:MAG TPA: IS21 family transposase [Gemmatimonadales bacterium]|nr:IS21 family transposase [Gemmatimonadales bacterium]
MRTTDAQVRKLMDEMHRHGEVGPAALRAGLSPNTARKYLRAGRLPSELVAPRTWRTRADPFAADWAELRARLVDAPDLEATTLFEDLLRRKPDGYTPGQVRTLQRRLKQWRAQEGPPKRIFFPQVHRPGEAMQTDFTWASTLGITIGGEPFPHLLCHPVLPYSNWEWATICQSESLAALRRGVQAALVRLGRAPTYHQTDNSTAATHDLRTGKRGFNAEYEALVQHYGMAPRTIEVGEKEQNGDVESLNGVLKRRLTQHLLLRGSREFESRDAYEVWVHTCLEAANRPRAARVAEELAVMRPLPAARLPEWVEQDVRVTAWSTIRVKLNAYSVPARLAREVVRVRIFDERLEVFFGGARQLTVARLSGRHGHRINYRHIIWSLVRSPGAFERYRYRDDLFPTPVFRRAYDTLCGAQAVRAAEVEYVRILHLAASTLETEVAQALERLLAAGTVPTAEAVRACVAPERPETPALAVGAVDLAEYDALLAPHAEVGA